MNGKEINDLVIPNSVTSIGRFAFCGCPGLSSVTIPSSVTSIGRSAFSGCSGLTSVHITDLAAWCNITMGPDYYDDNNPLYYAGHLFLNGKEINDLVIPNSVTSIGHHAFIGCSGLSSVTFPNSVTTIGSYAFRGCSQLYTIISFIENPFDLDVSSFEKDHYNNTSLFVPVGAIDKYKKAKGWMNFIWMEEGIPSGIQEEKVSNDEKTWYSLNGMKLESAKKGLNIIRHTNGKTSKVLIK